MKILLKMLVIATLLVTPLSFAQARPMIKTITIGLPLQNCLPEGTSLTDIVHYGINGQSNTTVNDELRALKAVCLGKKGLLISLKTGRRIYFFHPSCWGNPPADYLEIVKREQAQLTKMQRVGTVIVFTCPLFLN